MNEKDPFIIEDLDEYHLIIKADEEYRVRKELEAEVCIPSFSRQCPFSELSEFSWKRIHTAWRRASDLLVYRRAGVSIVEERKPGVYRLF